MELTNKILYFEDKLKGWIEKHRITWFFILFSMGILLGIGYNSFLDGEILSGVVMGLFYSSILVTCEFAMGGGGIK